MNCRHRGCLCSVETGADFCSDYCRKHEGEIAHGGHSCECGHASCSLDSP